jgi:hypothetical protein
VCNTVEELIEMEPRPYKGCFVEDELGFAFGDSEEEVISKLYVLTGQSEAPEDWQ